MHKKLESDLVSLAHSILQMKNRTDVFALKEKAQEVYERLSLLAFVEEYVNHIPNAKDAKETLTVTLEKALENKTRVVESTKEDVEKELPQTSVTNLNNECLEVENEKLSAEVADDFEEEEIEKQQEEVENESEYLEADKEDIEEEIAQPELEGLVFGDAKPQNFKDASSDEGKVTSLEDELKDTIPVDVMANLFEPIQQKSLNDQLQGNIQIGLNDRIAFVKNLFNDSQEDFNRVVSQLNTIKTEKEAKKFIKKMVKPDYNWSEHEDLENRFIEIVERKFIYHK